MKKLFLNWSQPLTAGAFFMLIVGKGGKCSVMTDTGISNIHTFDPASVAFALTGVFILLSAHFVVSKLR